MLAVIASIVAKAGEEDRLHACAVRVALLAEDEPGTIEYTAHASQTAAGEIWLYELYRDERALDTHKQRPEVKAALAELGELSESITSRRCDVAWRCLPK